MKIFFTKYAHQKFQNIQSYIKSNWGIIAKERFVNKTKHSLELLKLHPKLGTMEVDTKKIFGLQIHRHIRIFYRLSKDQISILTFFDVRQSPKRRPK